MSIKTVKTKKQIKTKPFTLEVSENKIRELRMEMMNTAIERYIEQNGNLERLLFDAKITIELQNNVIKKLSELEAQVENLPKWIRWIVK